jgi:RNA polymerase sigma factor (sigma-70 family)
MTTPTATRTTEEYRARNASLFGERRSIVDELAKVAGLPEGTRASVVLPQLHTKGVLGATVKRLLRRLERLNSEIVELNGGLAGEYVSKFTKVNRNHVDDYEGAALLGLMRAIDSYDPSLGPFGQWARRPIKREVIRALRENEFQTLAPVDFERRPEVLAARSRLVVGGNEDPSFEDIAVESGLPLEHVNRVMAPASLDSISAPIGADSDSTLGDTISDDRGEVGDLVLAGIVREALEAHGLPMLSAREFYVVCRRFGLDGEPEAKLSAIGGVLHLSREAVRNIEAKALARLAHPTVLADILSHGNPGGSELNFGQ